MKFHKTFFLWPILIPLLSSCLADLDQSRPSLRALNKADEKLSIERLSQQKISPGKKISSPSFRLSCSYRDHLAQTEGQVVLLGNAQQLQFLLTDPRGLELPAEFALAERGQKAKSDSFNITSIAQKQLSAQMTLAVQVSEIAQWTRHVDFHFFLDFSTGEGTLEERLYSFSFGEMDEASGPYLSLTFYSCKSN